MTWRSSLPRFRPTSAHCRTSSYRRSLLAIDRRRIQRGIDRQHVSEAVHGPHHPRVVTEQLAQPHDHRGQVTAVPRRRLVRPHLADQLLVTHRLAELAREGLEQHELLLREWHLPSVRKGDHPARGIQGELAEATPAWLDCCQHAFEVIADHGASDRARKAERRAGSVAEPDLAVRI